MDHFQNFTDLFVSFLGLTDKFTEFQKVNMLSSKYLKINHISCLKDRFQELCTILILRD